MRFIDNTDVPRGLRGDWQASATAAAVEMAACADAECRRSCLARHAPVWREAAPALATLSDRRCWYCEVRDIRADMPVDHYRPKGRVQEEGAAHDGYWWLAFCWENFRYSCTFCNSRRVDVEGGTAGGKWDHFPLCDGSQRARFPADNLDLERPLLLDPCREHDPQLITFDQSGEPQPTRKPERDAIGHSKATASIRLYHLDHRELVEARRQLWKKIDQLVDRGSRYVAEGYRDADSHLDDVKTDLHKLIRRSTPLSRVTRQALRGRRDVPWVREWLEEVEPTL